MTELRALTLWRPWDEPVACGAKPVENRSWSPPKAIVGQVIAIHAGKTHDHDARGFIIDRGYHLLSLAESNRRAGAIVGVTRIVAAFTEGDLKFDTVDRFKGNELYVERRTRVLESPWFFGPWGWLLEDAIAIDPVPCKGAMGLWRVPPDVAAEVLRRVEAKRA